MKRFIYCQSYSHFEWETKHKNRYVWSEEVKIFIRTIRATSEEFKENISAGSIFWRAQIGNDEEPVYENGEHIADTPCQFPPDRMKPKTGEASEGRANPKGIACLYLATHRETAISEVRPWVGSLVSVAQFKTLKELEVINVTEAKFDLDRYVEGLDFTKSDSDEDKDLIWEKINQAFSKPINLNDRVADYIPTQIIAELLKGAGYDGVAYASTLGPGHNLAIFNIDAAKLVNCSLYEVSKVDVDFKEICNPYFIKEGE